MVWVFTSEYLQINSSVCGVMTVVSGSSQIASGGLSKFCNRHGHVSRGFHLSAHQSDAGFGGCRLASTEIRSRIIRVVENGDTLRLG